MYPGAYVASTPDKPAVIVAETGWTQTFAELDAAANRLSNLFRSAGLEPGDHVAFCLENHPRFMEIVRRLLGSHSFQQPADISVFDNPITSDLYSRFTLEDKEKAIERYKLMRLAWDLVGTEFASRHTQYEMFYNGAPHVAMNRVWHFFRWQHIDEEVDRALKSIGTYEDLVANAKERRKGRERIAVNS